MKWRVVSLCVVLALIAISKTQPTTSTPRLTWHDIASRRWNPQRHKLFCRPWCILRQKVGSSCGHDCACIQPPPGFPERPLACIWSPARG
ncbi:hypothetical protein V5799_016037 [Amblyomma americanum]|uniref:Secreted protein n=1 Tax=Amblyomma americanum TaxID=6943 RepID=A0AAQ4F6W9_AMBAM